MANSMKFIRWINVILQCIWDLEYRCTSRYYRDLPRKEQSSEGRRYPVSVARWISENRRGMSKKSRNNNRACPPGKSHRRKLIQDARRNLTCCDFSTHHVQFKICCFATDQVDSRLAKTRQYVHQYVANERFGKRGLSD